MRGREEGRDDNWGLVSRSGWRGVREERRVERRRIRSRRSGGRECLDGDLGRLGRPLEGGVSGFRSRVFRALRRSCVRAVLRRAVLRAWNWVVSIELERYQDGVDFTSETASRSFCPACFFVEPDGLRILFASVECRAANFGLFCSTASSIGGSILGVNVVVDGVEVDC
jgi:hypothetical protein